MLKFQVRKAVLLEGSPGVGKTSLISALAAATGHEVWVCVPNLGRSTRGLILNYMVCCSGFASDTPWIPRVEFCLVPRPVEYHMHFCCEHWRKLTNSHLTFSPSRSWCESTSRSRRMCPTSSAQTCRCQTVNTTLPKANRPTNRLDRVLGSRGVTGCF